MKAYKAYLTIKDPKQVVLFDVPFEAGQEVEIVVLAKDDDESNRIYSLEELFKATQSLPQAQALSEDEISAEIEAYRNGANSHSKSDYAPNPQ